MSGARVIAIDGPSASGKSTVARRLAGELGWLYVDSGALYRAAAWLALKSGVRADDEAALSDMLDAAGVTFFVRDGAVRFRVGECEPVSELRTDEINRWVSPVAAQPGVRRRVVAWLRGMTRFGPLVMEGRDIGTAVFPETPHKFYLDASAEERARRRHLEEGGAAREAVGRSLAARDAIDSTRKTDPLREADGAVRIDSTSMTIEGVVSVILGRIGAGGS